MDAFCGLNSAPDSFDTVYEGNFDLSKSSNHGSWVEVRLAKSFPRRDYKAQIRHARAWLNHRRHAKRRVLLLESAAVIDGRLAVVEVSGAALQGRQDATSLYWGISHVTIMIRVSILYTSLRFFSLSDLSLYICRHMGAISVCCSWGVEQILDGGLRCRIEGALYNYILHTHMFSKNYRSYMHVYYMYIYIYMYECWHGRRDRRVRMKNKHLDSVQWWNFTEHSHPSQRKCLGMFFFQSEKQALQHWFSPRTRTEACLNFVSLNSINAAPVPPSMMGPWDLRLPCFFGRVFALRRRGCAFHGSVAQLPNREGCAQGDYRSLQPLLLRGEQRQKSQGCGDGSKVDDSRLRLPSLMWHFDEFCGPQYWAIPDPGPQVWDTSMMLIDQNQISRIKLPNHPTVLHGLWGHTVVTCVSFGSELQSCMDWGSHHVSAWYTMIATDSC